MDSLSYKNKSIIMGCICVALIIAIGITVVFLINSLDGNYALENKKEIENKVYATVKEVGDNYIKITSLDEGEEIHVNTNKRLNKGDFIVITYNEDEELSITPNDIEVIAENKEIAIPLTTTTTKSVYVSTTDNKTTKKTTTSKTTTKKSTTTKDNVSDEEVVEFAKLSYDNANNENKKSITTSIKKNFVTLIDFIFYNGTIKGKTFDELSNLAKAKVIYYTLLVDNKIDSKWPDYKETIKTKTSDLKAKLIAKYMDITTSLCEANENGCKAVKNDFAFLKKSLGLTWDIIKSAFSYGYNKTYTYLKNWYEVWREK